jgi:TolB-like protein/thioredoxin-like negative regulator of GroEL
MSLYVELRRRNVFKVGAAYLVVGWLLTEVLTTILPELGAPDWAPRAVILIFAFGFVPAIVLSWFYEVTPEGIKREEDLSPGESEQRASSSKFGYVTIATAVALVILIGLFSAQRAGEDAPTAISDVSPSSVAVLPFVNMSDDQRNEYFSDGLTETLLHMLAQVPDLQVAARTSSFAFKGQNRSVQEIAAALGVANILEGSVQRSGDNVRITAQLIRASDGFHLWSEIFDRTLDDIFGIQDEIAKKVGFALTESLLGGADSMLSGVQTRDADAYLLYMQARKERATFSYGGLKAAEDLLKGALLIDPDFVEAKTELAVGYVHQLETGLMDQAEAFPEILAITEQVLAVRPDDPVSQAVRTYVEAGDKVAGGDANALPAATQRLEELVAESPDNFEVLAMLLRAYRSAGQGEKAIPLLESAQENDPFNPQIHYELGTAFMHAERHDEARASFEQALEIEPAQPNVHSNLAFLALDKGDGVGYVQHFIKAVEIDPRDHELPGILANFLYRLELVDEGDDFRDRVVTIAPTSEMAYHTELLRAIATDDDQAADASARRAIEDGINDRRFAWGGAIQYLLRAAIRNDSIESEVAWLEQQEPGILDVENTASGQKYRAAQGMALEAWYVSLPKEELMRRAEILIAHAESMGIRIQDSAYAQMNLLAVRGEIQQAVQVALERIFDQSVATNLNWEDNLAQAQLSEVVADPRIQAAMQRWRDEEERLRDEVRTYLTDLMAAS